MPTTTGKKRYAYIDNMKFAACILVAVGHFTMSMTANQLMAQTDTYMYFLDTLYSFLVPVFFVCSGFLYQKADRVHSLGSWGVSIRKKLLDLGVPYTVFSTITVLLKTMFEDDVTSKSGGLLDTLLLNPTAPYWYLYVLFFFFLFTPCMKSKKAAGWLLAGAFVLKAVLAVLYTNRFSFEQVVKDTTHNYILYCVVRMAVYSAKRYLFFAAGMLLAFLDENKIKKIGRFAAPVLLAGALVYSLSVYNAHDRYDEIELSITGILFLAFTVISAIAFAPQPLNKISAATAEFFMPVFVLHTICAAGIRIMLLKLGITNLAVHILGGIVGSFVLPAVALIICQKLTPLLFFFYPTKTIRLMRQKHEQNQRAVSEK